MTINLDEISKLLGEITQGEWVAMSVGGYPIVGVKHPPVEDGKKCQLKVISVLTTDQMKGLGNAIQIELDDEDRANLGLIAAAPTVIKELVEQNKAFLARNEGLQREKDKMQAVVDSAKALRSWAGSFSPDIRKLFNNSFCERWCVVCKDTDNALAALDAKEQDDAQAD